MYDVILKIYYQTNSIPNVIKYTCTWVKLLALVITSNKQIDDIPYIHFTFSYYYCLIIILIILLKYFQNIYSLFLVLKYLLLFNTFLNILWKNKIISSLFHFYSEYCHYHISKNKYSMVLFTSVRTKIYK